MSLNWTINKVKDFEKTCYIDVDGNKQLSHATNALIWLTMGVDMGEITNKNKDEFFSRVQKYEKILGAMRQDDKGFVYVTKDEVYAHVGLGTNVRTLSAKAFERKLSKIALA